MLGEDYPMKNTINIFAVIISIALFTGCASRRFVSDKEKDKREAGEKSVSLSYYEAMLNPADYDRDIEDTVTKSDLGNTIVNLPEIPKDTLIVQEEIVQGFRIQVLSTSGVDEANSMREVLHWKFPGDSIYIIYDTPLYKLRIGDFFNRYEANQRLPEFVEKGYKDAWIVPDRIIRRSFVKVPLSK